MVVRGGPSENRCDRHLRPTASGKTAVAEAVADRLDGDLISADAMQVYRGLPVLTNQPARATRLVAVWPLDHEASVAEYQSLAHEAIDDAITAGRRRSWSAGRASTCARLSLTSHSRRLPIRPPASASSGSTTGSAPSGPTSSWPSEILRPQRACTRTTVGASSAPSSWREAGSRWRRTETTCGLTRCVIPTLVFGLDVPREVLTERIVERTARSMFERGAEEEARAALAGPISATARHIIGLRELDGLPREEAIAALEQRTRRYAAYQRKWMRRIPGLIALDGTRPAGRSPMRSRPRSPALASAAGATRPRDARVAGLGRVRRRRSGARSGRRRHRLRPGWAERGGRVVRARLGGRGVHHPHRARCRLRVRPRPPP